MMSMTLRGHAYSRVRVVTLSSPVGCGSRPGNCGVGFVVAGGRRQCGSGAQDLARVFASVADGAHAGRCPLRRQANRCREHAMSRRPLIAHVLYRLDTGGMERIAVSVINRTSE